MKISSFLGRKSSIGASFFWLRRSGWRLGRLGGLGISLLTGCMGQIHDFPPNFIEIPPHSTASTNGAASALAMGRTEVSVLEYTRFLNATAAPTQLNHDQILIRQGRFLPARGQAHRPIAFVSHYDAEAYCAWFSSLGPWLARLPTHAEWARAARGGQSHAAFPWGWGAPHGKAVFAAREASRVGRYAPNPLGFHDMAGNVFEWCAPAAGTLHETCPAAGGSWAETDPFLLAIDRVTHFPCDYRNADVGFRVLLERP